MVWTHFSPSTLKVAYATGTKKVAVSTCVNASTVSLTFAGITVCAAYAAFVENPNIEFANFEGYAPYTDATYCGYVDNTTYDPLAGELSCWIKQKRSTGEIILGLWDNFNTWTVFDQAVLTAGNPVNNDNTVVGQCGNMSGGRRIVAYGGTCTWSIG